MTAIGAEPGEGPPLPGEAGGEPIGNGAPSAPQGGQMVGRNPATSPAQRDELRAVPS